MKLMTENIGGRDIQIALFAVPMMHEDWHEAEEAGFVYVTYQHEGPDYWDDSMVFSKPEDKKVVADAFTGGG